MKYTQADKEKVFELYNQGFSTYQIEDMINIPKSTVQKWVSEKGISRTKKTREELEKMKDKIKELYFEGLTSKEIAKILDAETTSVAYHVREMGISRDRGVISPIGVEDYFDNIDTERKAYFLGWLMADGNVSIYNNQYSIKIHINKEDISLIHEFLKDIKCNNKISFKNNDAVYVSVSSKHMVNSLIKHGVIPNKTGKEYLPELNEDLLHHFIRGFFDGDGITCIKKHSETNNGGLRSGFVSTLNMCNQIQGKLGTDLKIYKTKGAYYFTGGIKFSQQLYQYMYKDANIWLERKRQRMNIICMW